MASTGTPGSGSGGGPANVYAATAPPMTAPARTPVGPAQQAGVTPAPVPAGGQPAAAGPQPTRKPGGLAATRSAARAWVAEQFSGTPGRLRLATLACIVVGLLLGATGFSAVQTKASGLDQARRDLDQLVTVQAAYNALAEADAQATTLFLAGGLENPEGRRIYLDRIDLAGRALSRASAGAGDLRTRAELQAAHVALTRYAGLVEAARANNRQGFPIGAAYLKQASAVLHSSALPVLAKIQAREEVALNTAGQRGRGALLSVVGGLALVLLGLIQLWLFRITRRILNLPLVVVTVVTVVMLIAASVILGAAAGRTDDLRRQSLAEVLALTRARVSAFDAKSNGSLALIARGNGQPYTEAADRQIAVAKAAALQARSLDGATSRVVGSLVLWIVEQADVRELDASGYWDFAVERATRPADDPRYGPNTAFETFNSESSDALQRAIGRLDGGLARAADPPRTAALPLLLLGVLLAAAGWLGISRRAAEFR